MLRHVQESTPCSGGTSPNNDTNLWTRVLEDSGSYELSHVLKDSDGDGKRNFDSKKLRKITVTIQKLASQTGDTEMERDIHDPSTVRPVRRSGIFKNPIFFFELFLMNI